MRFDSAFLDELTRQAKSSARLRFNYDLRNSSLDMSQRMINALEPGTVVPVHRHTASSETVVCLRGHLKELFYDDNGLLTEVVDLKASGECYVMNIPKAQWHTVKVLDSGTVILEFKEGPYRPLAEDDVLIIPEQKDE